MTEKQKARTLRLTEQDQAAINRLKAYYGLTSDNEIIRLALHAALREIEYLHTSVSIPHKPQADEI